MDEQERRWREEREKVLEEWSEIELKFREGTPVRINMSRESLDFGDGPFPEKHTVISEPTSWSEERPPGDPLLSKLLSANYEDEKSLVRSSIPLQVSTMNSFMRRCICRPTERLSNEEVMEEKILLLAMTKKPYSSATAHHWPILLDFYRSIASFALDDVTLASECPSIGSHWQICGFQGTNPMTDFRGVGVFGLLQLYCFVHSMEEESLKKIVKLSRNEPNDFPLAVVGLNISSFIADRMRGDDLNSLVNQQGSFLSVVNRLYNSSFNYFAKVWQERNCTITDTQTILTEINGLLRTNPWRILKQCP